MPRNERPVAAASHALGILTLFLGPLVMYFLFKRNASPWLRAHLDEAVNYHILVPIVCILLVVGGILLNSVASTASLIMLLVAVLIFLAATVMTLLAAIWAARGKTYHYPFDVKIVR